MLGFDAINVCNAAMGIMAIIITCLNDLDVGFCNIEFLGKFLAKEFEGNLQITVEKLAY